MSTSHSQEGKPAALDLFAGAGGATQGLRQAGFDVVAAVEIDGAAARTYEANHDGTHLSRSDLGSLNPGLFRRFLERTGRLDERLDLLNACPPCQGFSSRGARDAVDIRNDLALVIVGWAETFLPRVVVVENVLGLRSDARYVEVAQGLRALGYGVQDYDEDAVRFGVPQRRRRLIVLGVHGLGDDELPEDLAAAVPATFDRGVQKAGDWIRLASDAPPDDPLGVARTLKPTTLQRVMAVPERGSRFDLPPHLRLACHDALDATTGGRRATESYGRIDPDQPAPTMTTRCTTVSCGRFTHPTEHRGLTLREAALLQTFPLEYRFEGAYGSVERQIGNALPVRMTEGIGRVALGIMGGA